MPVSNIREIPNPRTITKSVETSLDAADTECPRHDSIFELRHSPEAFPAKSLHERFRGIV
jgi:hypothetical protein